MLPQISYAGEMSSNYGLYMCNADGFSVTTVAGNQLSTETKHMVGSDEFLAINPSYSETMEDYTFQLCKIENCQFLPITPLEYSAINRWLNRRESHEFKVDYPGWESLHWIGRMNVKPVNVGDKIVGIEVTFSSDYPYGFDDEIHFSELDNKTFTLHNISDEVGDIYPEFVKITCKSNGKLTLKNSQDNEILEIEDCTSGEIFTINSKRQIINSNQEAGRKSDSNRKSLQDAFNWNFPKVSNTYDNTDNVYESNINIDLELKYCPVRKVGII